jgi:hypothetical protein
MKIFPFLFEVPISESAGIKINTIRPGDIHTSKRESVFPGAYRCAFQNPPWKYTPGRKNVRVQRVKNLQRGIF